MIFLLKETIFEVRKYINLIEFSMTFSLLQVILIAIESYGPSDIGVGIWSGVFYGVAGAIGIYSAYRTTGCT